MTSQAVAIAKSSRHSKITGDFAEAIILYWLSKHGFECARVDHTGMDIIARNPHTRDLIGISVKSRSRNPGTEETYVKIEESKASKLIVACNEFGCKPYFAIVVDAGTVIRCFIMTLKHVQKLCGARAYLGLGMKAADIERYNKDHKIISFEFQSTTRRWWLTKA
jgi:Holliday junction resolvase